MNNRRKTENYLPEPRFQLRFIRFLMIGSFIQIALVCAILYFFLSENYRILVNYAGLEPEITSLLYRELRTLMGVLISVFIFFLLGIGIWGTLYSHHIGGVITALKRTIARINAGEDAVLTLRKNDEFQEVVDMFNLMVRNMKERKRNSA